MNGYGGADYIEGGEFGDILIGGRGNDFIQGFDGDDLLFGEAGKNIIVAGGGDDQICADGGRASDRNDVLGEAGNDAFNAAAPSADFFDGGSSRYWSAIAVAGMWPRANLATGRSAGGAAGDRLLFRRGYLQLAWRRRPNRQRGLEPHPRQEWRRPAARRGWRRFPGRRPRQRHPRPSRESLEC